MSQPGSAAPGRRHTRAECEVCNQEPIQRYVSYRVMGVPFESEAFVCEMCASVQHGRAEDGLIVLYEDSPAW
jgi:hypothetical protein